MVARNIGVSYKEKDGGFNMIQVRARTDLLLAKILQKVENLYSDSLSIYGVYVL
jgi:hypothetical protein